MDQTPSAQSSPMNSINVPKPADLQTETQPPAPTAVVTETDFNQIIRSIHDLALFGFATKDKIQEIQNRLRGLSELVASLRNEMTMRENRIRAEISAGSEKQIFTAGDAATFQSLIKDHEALTARVINLEQHWYRPPLRTTLDQKAPAPEPAHSDPG